MSKLDVMSLLLLFILNAVIWILLHITLSILIIRIPDTWFRQNNWLFRPFPFEKKGAVWQEWTKVKAWKDYVPDGTLFIKSGYDKKHLHGTAPEALQKFSLESKRAELVHYFMIIPSFLFFLWNPPWAAIVNIVYAFSFNLPLIIIQRYNRPRIERILQRLS